MEKYLLTAAGGYIGCLFISALSMLVSAKTRSTVVAVLVPFILIFIPSFLANINSPAVARLLGLLPDQLLQSGPKPFEKSGESAEHFGMGLYSSGLLCRKHGGVLRLELLPALPALGGELPRLNGGPHGTAGLGLVAAVGEAALAQEGLHVGKRLPQALPGLPEAQLPHPRGVDDEDPAGQAQELAAGDEVLLLTQDDQIYYIVRKVAHAV